MIKDSADITFTPKLSTNSSITCPFPDLGPPEKGAVINLHFTFTVQLFNVQHESYDNRVFVNLYHFPVASSKSCVK